MGTKTISEFANQYSENTIIFNHGDLQFKITKTAGAITSQHNFGGSWILIPANYTIQTEQHMADHNAVRSIQVYDVTGGLVFEMDNMPGLTLYNYPTA